MISYLLSGWRVYVPDENGNPLYQGRVYFYDASTSQPSTVYADKDQVTSLGTYVDVDGNGFLPAIWLDSSHLYKIVVKRLIQEDPETWQTMWEINDVGNPFLTSGNVTGESNIVVNTISELRALDPNDAERPEYVYVMGWNNPGDTGSPMLFRWVQNASGNDGHWISPTITGVGAWEQIFDGELDPRKFGAIPDSGNYCDTSLHNCMMYATEPHTYDSSDPKFYFPKTVRFVKEGIYRLDVEFDFTIYTMISQYDSAPVTVVIEDGVYLGGPVKFDKGVQVNSSRPIASYPRFMSTDGFIKFSWFERTQYIRSNLQTPKIVFVDKDTSTSLIPLSGKVIVNMLDSMPSGVSLTDCVLIDAHDGSVSPTLLKLGAYVVSHSTGILNQLLFRMGSSNVMKFEDSLVKIFNTLDIPEGWKIDNDNFMMQPDGENEKYLNLKIKAFLDLTSLNGEVTGIKFDKAQIDRGDIRSLTARIISAQEDADRYNIRFDNGAYWNNSSTKNIYISTAVEYNLGTFADFSSYDRFNIICSWWWNSSNSKSQICQPIWLSGANGKEDGSIIKIVNMGPQLIDANNGYQINLTDWTEMHTFYSKSGNIFVLDNSDSNRIIAVIPPFCSANFLLTGNSWKEVSM
jgi:hypothetical protein